MTIGAATRKSVDQHLLRTAKGFRLISSSARLLPDFIIIGGQRCGTTSLYNYLTDHPDVAGARRKEVHFFDNNFHRGTNWYTAHFPLSLVRRARQAHGRHFVTGEGSPYYLFHPHAPRRIRQVVPNAKLIVLLRNPVDRAYSHYHLSVRLGFETLPFEQALAAEATRLDGERDRMIEDESYYSFSHQHHSYLARGIYADQLNVWLDIFPKQQLLLLKSEDFYTDQAATVRQVTNFIGIDPYRKSRYNVHNEGKYSSLGEESRVLLRDYYEPHNRRLYDALGLDFGWDD